MTTVHGAAPVARSHRRVWIATALVAIVLVATGWYWAFRPDELSDYKPMRPGGMTLMQVGFTEYATQLIGPQDNPFRDSTINLREVRRTSSPTRLALVSVF